MGLNIRPAEASTLDFIADGIVEECSLQIKPEDDKAAVEAIQRDQARIRYGEVIRNADQNKAAVLRVYDTDAGDIAWAHWELPHPTEGYRFEGQPIYRLMRVHARALPQARDAVQMLLRWPFEEADRKGLRCTVRISDEVTQVRLNEMHGFDSDRSYKDPLGKELVLIREPNTTNVLTAGILIISDTASEDPSTDKSGAVLKEVFESEGGGLWRVGATAIVPDNFDAIQSRVKEWCGGKGGAKASAFNLILTTGGTGFAVKDLTPEAIEPLLERKAPGLVHAMLSASLQVTPFAAMSRPVAGTRGKTLIISVPGSPKGAKENLQAVLKLLPHACQQSAGAHSRSLHAGGVKKLEMDAGVSSSALGGSQAKSHDHHHHHHGHDHGHHHGPAGPHTKPEDRPQPNDPNAGPTARYRESPYPKLEVSDAISRILAQTPDAVVTERPVNPELVGNILAEDVTAPHPVPAFRASIVDGYAVITKPKSTNEKGTFEVAAISHAAAGKRSELPQGKIARITTGAPLPPNATAVVMVEDTVLHKMTPDGKEEAEVELLTDAVKDGENVREVGSDIPKGEVILKKGDRVSAVGGELGLLASVGRAAVKVYKKPVIGIMSTGDEIVPHDREGDLKLGEVRDTNRITLMSAIGGWGYEIVDLGIAKDAPGDLESTLRTALRRADVIVTTGGVSMGELDLLKPTIERSLGGTIHFGRVAMKPGMPTTFATVPFKSIDGDPKTALIFSLPGNPASGMVTASLFLRPCLDQWSGVDKSRIGAPRAKVVLAADTRSDPKREEYQRAVVWQGQDGRLYGETTGFQRSSRIGSFNKANALLIVAPGQGVLEKGRILDAMLLAGLGN